MKIIFSCLFILVSVALHAQTLTVLSDSTHTPAKLDCLGDKPIYVVNYKILPCDSVRFIKPDDINEVQILNSASANALFGAMAGFKNGAVIITTKEYVALQKRNKKNSTKTKKP
jgi:hypothetical protein